MAARIAATCTKKDARARGETEQRLYLLNAWRESPFYAERERAGLAWTEAVTLVSETHVPDDVFEEVKKQFSDEEIVNLTSCSRRSTAETASRSASGPCQAIMFRRTRSRRIGRGKR
jgi:alkylhydroperoxidase family enzyme